MPYRAVSCHAAVPLYCFTVLLYCYTVLHREMAGKYNIKYFYDIQDRTHLILCTALLNRTVVLLQGDGRQVQHQVLLRHPGPQQLQGKP
jgi:hypothetical protein